MYNTAKIAELFVVLHHDRRVIVAVAKDTSGLTGGLPERVYIRLGDLKHLRQYDAARELRAVTGFSVPLTTYAAVASLVVKFRGSRYTLMHDARRWSRWERWGGKDGQEPMSECIRLATAREGIVITAATDALRAPLTFENASTLLKINIKK